MNEIQEMREDSMGRFDKIMNKIEEIKVEVKEEVKEVKEEVKEVKEEVKEVKERIEEIKVDLEIVKDEVLYDGAEFKKEIFQEVDNPIVMVQRKPIFGGKSRIIAPQQKKILLLPVVPHDEGIEDMEPASEVELSPLSSFQSEDFH